VADDRLHVAIGLPKRRRKICSSRPALEIGVDILGRMARQRAGGSSAATRGAPWRQLETNYNWEDLVLPGREGDLLHAIVVKACFPKRRFSGEKPDPFHWLERAPRAVFVGPPSTGKTMAAQVIAAALGRPIFAVDLGNVLSRDQQEAEADIDRTFAAAEGSHAVLLFNGAELLVPRRLKAAHRERVGADAAPSSPSHQLTDEPEALAVLEARGWHLLEGSRRYGGLVIFAGTATQAGQAWLADRFDVIVRFPFPERDARKEIWRRVLPSDARVTENGLNYLATWLRWPGGTIRRCGEEAAVEARRQGVPLQLHHVTQVLERGYRTQVFPEAERKTRSVEQIQEKTAPIEFTTARKPGEIRRFLRPARARAALVGMLIAAVLGSILAREMLAGPSVHWAVASARAGILQISYPSNWRVTRPPATPRLRLTDELALALGRGLLVVGRTTGYPGPLPQSVITRLDLATVPQIVKVGTVRLYRYATAPQTGSASESIYTAPTTAGTIVGICRTDGGGVKFVSNCERALGTIRLRAGTFLPVGLTGTYAQTVTTVIASLNAARASQGAELARPTNSQSAVRAARDLAAAHAAAASALLRVSAGPASTVNASLANALQMSARAYTALALAAAGKDQRAYNAARVSLARASEALRSAFAQLSQLGYRVS
jgi:ATPase family protein associated with various cellular activities (AAA)